MRLGKATIPVFKLFFLKLVFISSISFAQDGDSLLLGLKINPDTSALRMVIRTCGKLRSQQPDSSLKILDQILVYIASNKDEQIRAEYLNERGATLNNLGRYDEALKNLELAHTKFVALKHKRGIASSQNNTGNSLLRKGLTEEALEMFIAAEAGFLEVGAIDKAISAQQAQGAVFLELGNTDMALKIFKRAEQTAVDHKLSENLLYIRLNTGSVYYAMGVLDTAAMYYQLVGQEAERLGQTSIQIAAYSNLASVYFEQHQLEKTIELENKSLALAKEIQDIGMQISILNNMAGSYATLGNYSKANELMDESMRLCEATNSLRSELNVTKTKADILYQSGQGKEAYEWLLKHLAIKDSIMNADNQGRLAELEAEHNEFKNEQEIRQLEKDQVISDKELELSKASEQKFLYAAVAIGVVLLVIVVALIVNFRKNRELRVKNQLIEENLKEKEILLMEVHHRVKNNLQMIYSILNMQTKDASEEAAALLHENKDRIRSISIIHEKLYMNEDLGQTNLNDLFREISENAGKTSPYGKSTEIEVACDALSLDMDTLISLGILVNELVTNSLKYAFKGTAGNRIAVALKKTGEDKISLSVSDNGAGFPANFSLSHSHSFGFRMIQTLCKKLKGSIFIENKNGAFIQIDIHRFKAA